MSQPQPRLQSTGSKSAQDALITSPTAPLIELRQNNPQDCSNLIAASVDRATVEISRTIIRLNATFSQQLQQASISASNGIKSAENSASSSISIVSLNASSATSSASFSLNLANLAVTSVNSALTNANNALTNANNALASAQSQVVGVNLVLTSALSASTSDVLRLSSSLSSLEATLVSVQASASSAVALAVMNQQSSKDPQFTAAISLAPIQLAGIIVGTMLASVFLSFAVGFVLIRARNKEKHDSFNDKGSAMDPKMPPSRSSMEFPTGNSVVIKFSPPTSIHNFPPAPKRHGDLSATHPDLTEQQLPIATVWNAKASPNNPFMSRTNEWPLTSSFDDNLHETSNELWSQNFMAIPHAMSAQNTEVAPGSSSARELYLDDSQEFASTTKSALPAGKEGHGEAIGTSDPIGPDSDPAAYPSPSFESMHPIPGGFRTEAIETSHELDPDEGLGPVLDSAQESSLGLTIKKPKKLAPGKGALEDPFKDPTLEPYENLSDINFGDLVDQPSEQPIKTSSDILTDGGYLEEAGGQEAKTFWNKPNEILIGEGADLELVTSEVEGSWPEPGPSSPVAVAHTRDPGAPAPTDQSRTTSPQSSFQYVRTTSPEQVQEQARGNGSSSGTQATVLRPLPESRDRTISPLRRSPSVGFLGRRIDSHSPAAKDEEREISPLRRNPPFEPFEAIITLLDEQREGAVDLEEDGEANKYESRGRSMIRTSDILEARLSSLAQVNVPHEEILQQGVRQGETDGSQPASPAPPLQVTPSHQAHRLQTPPTRKPVAAEQKTHTENSIPLASNSLSRPVSATSAAVTQRREEASPLRRNPTGISPPSARAPGARPAANSSTKEFSKALSKFQTLISQNPQDAVVASNEVTSRAIAGIYIPGSLREQAVRNLSKSRERGTGERQRT